MPEDITSLAEVVIGINIYLSISLSFCFMDTSEGLILKYMLIDSSVFADLRQMLNYSVFWGCF